MLHGAVTHQTRPTYYYTNRPHPCSQPTYADAAFLPRPLACSFATLAFFTSSAKLGFAFFAFSYALRVHLTRPEISSALPPAASILALAELENATALMVRALVSSPVPRTFSGNPVSLPVTDRNFSLTASSVTSSPASKFLSRSKRLTTTKSGTPLPIPPAMPRSLGRRRYSGVWPPSKPGRTDGPERAFWPRLPKPHVPPWPAP
mmetsp:Transcript_34736/g.103050  ORF Transcript_34736/g.103050 Transcript_34736/m.103050 type:complete len:205 (-) Transcript_34736:236-850(-)